MFESRKFLNLLFVLFGVSILNYEIIGIANCQTTSASKPHVILIVADDVGWNDVSFHGSNEIPTPNIDALAYNGVILNRHYVQPLCTPSRAALMTGRYPIREGLQGTPLNVGEPRGLRLNVTIMPEHMRRLGYETQLLGKWHLGYHTENHTPARRGFDSFFGYYNAYISYFGKTIYTELKNGKLAAGYDLHRDGPDGLHVEANNNQYFTDLITDEAERIIRNNGNKKPLFLEIAHLATHASYTPSAGFELEVRDASENDASFSYISGDKSRNYAGMMKAMDDSVGRVVKALADAKMLENSIVIFVSDNGAPTTGRFRTPGSNYPLRGIKNTPFEGGIRGAACIFSPLISNPSRISEELIHISDWLPTLYSAAGGDTRDLGEIDGVDQWNSLVNNGASPRRDFLVNIDEIRGVEAAVVGRYKLVKAGRSITGRGYYGSENYDFYPTYDVEKVWASSAGRAISRLSGHENVSSEKARNLRESATVQCERPEIRLNCFTYCLFDIISDPCETKDLSSSHSEQLQALRSYIDELRKVSVPQQTETIDSCSLPSYFNNSWMPWRRNDVKESTIVPESICRAESI